MTKQVYMMNIAASIKNGNSHFNAVTREESAIRLAVQAANRRGLGEALFVKDAVKIRGSWDSAVAARDVAVKHFNDAVAQLHEWGMVGDKMAQGINFAPLVLPRGEAGTWASIEDFDTLIKVLKEEPELVKLLKAQGCNALNMERGAAIWGATPQSLKDLIAQRLSKQPWGASVVASLPKGKITELNRYLLPELAASVFWAEDGVKFWTGVLTQQQERLAQLYTNGMDVRYGAEDADTLSVATDEVYAGSEESGTLEGRTLAEIQESKIEKSVDKLHEAMESIDELKPVMDDLLALLEEAGITPQFRARAEVEVYMGVFGAKRTRTWTPVNTLAGAREAYEAAKAAGWTGDGRAKQLTSKSAAEREAFILALEGGTVPAPVVEAPVSNVVTINPHLAAFLPKGARTTGGAE
jgi:hypothetical protein